eukprot:m.126034 g.126034  ORF g.126034 m.126034 type:complete len:729 (+) comp29173_c0_seq1:263-2449(+)
MEFIAPNCTEDLDCNYAACGGGIALDPATCDDNGMCVCAKRGSFFVGLGLYIGLMIMIALYSHGQGEKTMIKTVGTHATSATAGSQQLKDHFMASGSFGSFVMGLTIFSTAFSGYTVAGVPQEASELGFISFRWLQIGIMINLFCLCYYPRLRRVGVARKYNAPTDLLVDRFHSNSLRLMSSLVLTIPLFIYVTVQFKAMGDIIEGLSLGRVDKHLMVWVLCVVIVFCEIVGGQRSVTLSDAVQAVIMLMAFFIMPFIVAYYYGFLSDIMGVGCKQSHITETGRLEGCVEYAMPWLTFTPSVTQVCDYDNRFTDPNCFASHLNGTTGVDANDTSRWVTDPDNNLQFQQSTLSMFSFLLNSAAFPLNPHFLQKMYVAKSDEVLKRSLVMVTFGGLVAQVPAIYYGFVKAAHFSDASASAFPLVTGELIEKGGVAEIVAVLASCSALAAIMSTADSCIIGANNVLTVDWIKYWIWKSASPKQISNFSKCFTPVFAILAVIFSFNTEHIPFATLLNLQNSFVWQVVPSYTVALYTDRIAAHPLMFGQLVGLIVCVSIEASLLGKGSSDLPSGIWGLIANVVVVVSSQLALSKMGSTLADDELRVVDRIDTKVAANFGQTRLTVKQIEQDIVHGITEPAKDRKAQLIMGVILLLLFLSQPWYSAPYTQQSIGAGGFVTWGTIIFIFYIVELVLVVYVFTLWKTRAEDDHEPTSEGATPLSRANSSSDNNHFE